MIIPSVNRPNFEAAKKDIKKAEEFAQWIHIDVSDGKFTPHLSWGDPQDLKTVETNLKIEVHLMVEKPDEVFEDWLKAGVKRIIIHLESVRDLENISRIATAYNAEVMLAIRPDTLAEALLPYKNTFTYFQILCVSPGPSGQKFQESSLEKVKFLQEQFSDATIEVDGGINPETARLSQEAGADILVAGAYIFSNPDPKTAYHELASI